MALLVSSWSKGARSLPSNYVMPPEKRPGEFIEVCKEIPVIDLQNNRSEIIQQIVKGFQEFGSVQVINHGVSEELMADMIVLYDEFFNLPIEDKTPLFSKEYKHGCMLFTGAFYYDNDSVHTWKDSLKHDCYPLEKQTPTWPDKPARYREVVERYVTEVRKIAFKILALIEEGLGLNAGYFDELSQGQSMTINYYPPCPDPSLAMGVDPHQDLTLMTFIQQDIYGLQIEKDGKWMGFDPMPNAFVIVIGNQFEAISNGMFKSVKHRAITNSSVARTSVGTFFGPNADTVIQPAKELVTPLTPQMFKPYIYKEFLANSLVFSKTPIANNGAVLDLYQL